MSLRRDTYAMINLKYLKENIETIYKRFKRPLMAVIKADAYGHGYKEVASYIKDLDYIEMFAVATLQEAIELRELGITKGILILGAVPTTKEEIELAISYDISLTMISLEYMYHLQTLISNKPLKIHIKLDTGMQRIGLTNKKELEKSDSQIAGTVAQSPINIGKKAVDIALNVLDGKDFEAETSVDVFMINKENVEMYGADGWQ